MSSQTPDSLLYCVADAMQMAIHETSEGRLRGFETKKLNVGPWKFDADVSIISDVLSEDTATFFVKVVGHLWFYIISRPQDQLQLIALDGNLLKLHVKDVAHFGGRSVLDTLKKIQPGIVATYSFNKEAKKWEDNDSSQQEPVHLDAKQKAGHVAGHLTGPHTVSAS